MNNRIEYIDAAKAVTMILVIVGHCSWLHFVFRGAIYAFHMPLFFMISGYFIKELSVKDAFSKYSRLYLKPYVISCLLMLALSLLTVFFHGGEYVDAFLLWCQKAFFASGWDQGPGYFASVPRIGVLWFLFGLFWACVIYSVLKKYFTLAERFVWVLFLFALSYESIQFVRLPFSIQGGMAATSYLFFGDLWRNSNLKERVLKLNTVTKGVAVCAALFSAFYYGGVGISTCDYNHIFATLPSSIVLCILLFFILKYKKVKGGWIGMSTLYILCGHALSWDLLAVFGINLDNLPFIGFVNFFIEVTVLITLGLGLGYLMKRMALFGKK